MGPFVKGTMCDPSTGRGSLPRDDRHVQSRGDVHRGQDGIPRSPRRTQGHLRMAEALSWDDREFIDRAPSAKAQIFEHRTNAPGQIDFPHGKLPKRRERDSVFPPRAAEHN